jgi:hypothetical protein
MTTKKTVKAVKPAVKPYVATPTHIKLATACGEALNTAGSAKARADQSAAKLHKAGAVVGAKGKCPLAIAFIDARFPKGLNAKREPVSAGTIDTVLGEFRKAVKTGNGYDENSGRATGKAKGKKTGAKAGGSGNILISISKAAKPEKAVESLLKGFNAMKKTETLVGLAAFLIDALDDAKAKKFNPLAK